MRAEGRREWSATRYSARFARRARRRAEEVKTGLLPAAVVDVESVAETDDAEDEAEQEDEGKDEDNDEVPTVGIKNAETVEGKLEQDA